MFKKLLGDPNTRKLKKYFPLVSDVNILEEDLLPLSDDDLRTRTTKQSLHVSKLLPRSGVGVGSYTIIAYDHHI